MSETHQIDQLFRDGLHSREVSYDPQEWLNAKKMLDDYDKKLFYQRFLKYLLALLLLVSSGIFISQNSSDFDNNKMKKIESSAATNSNELMNEAESDLPHSIGTLNPIIQQKSLVKNQNSSKQEGDFKRKLENNADIIRTKPLEEENAGPFNSLAYDSDRITDKTTKNGGSKSSQAIVSPVLTQMNNNNDIEVEENMTEDVSSSDIQLNGSIAGFESFYKNNALASNNTKRKDELQLMNVLLLEHDFPEELPLEESNVIPGVGKDKSNNFRTTGLKLVGGGGLTNHISGESRESINGLSAFLGVGYEKLVYHNISVEARLLFSRRNAFDLEYESEQTDYGFGFTSEFTSTQFHHLDYLEMPLFVNYFVHPLHQVGVGIQLNYALAQSYEISTSKVSSYTLKDSLTLEPVTEVTLEKKYGPSSIVNRIDLSIILYYHYSLTERIKVGAGLQFGAGDVVRSAYQADVPYRNNQFRFNLTYRLFD